MAPEQAVYMCAPSLGPQGSSHEQTPERRAEGGWRDAAERDGVGADEVSQGPQGTGQAPERRVAVERAPRRDRRARPAGEPRLEMDTLDLEPTFGAVDFRIDPPDELAIVEDRQRVVAVGALVAWGIHLDRVAEPEQAVRPLAMPEERVER